MRGFLVGIVEFHLQMLAYDLGVDVSNIRALGLSLMQERRLLGLLGRLRAAWNRALGKGDKTWVGRSPKPAD